MDNQRTVIALAVTFVLVMLAMLIYSESASDLPLIAFCHSLSDNDYPPVRRKPILTFFASLQS